MSAIGKSTVDHSALDLALKARLRETELGRQVRRAEARADQLLRWTIGAWCLQTVVIVGAVVALARALGG
jgi:hypothetical protein